MLERYAQRKETQRFSEEAKAILKSELKRNRLTYAELADRLTRTGLPLTEPALRNKISRGGFGAGFFIQCLVLIGTQTIQIGSAAQLYEQQQKLDLEP